ncbi:MAG TPA: FAD-dependent oxidoreductase, partial [Candidatus Dormibacteraeota bacterium]
MTTAARRDCLVVGAGVVGLAVGLALARRNQSVTVLERAERCGEGASAAAAGMLAAGSEAGEPDAFQALCRAGRQLWPGWAEQLRRDSGIDCELELTGLVRVATTEETARGMDGQARWQREHGLDVSELLDRARLAELVPGLGPAVLAGLHYPGDGHVHSHRMVDALLAACLRLGVTVETGVEV